MRLSNDAYEKIKETVADLYEDYGLHSFPIDVFELCHLMNIELIFKSILSLEKKEEMDRICGDRDAFKFCKEGQVYIYVNDISFSYRHQRYSIAHEIGHYVLSHRECNEQTESEADFFARYLMSPACICLHRLFTDGQLESTFWLEEMTGLTYTAASHALDGFEKRIRYGPSMLDYEKRILAQFDSSLISYLSK